MNHYKQNVEHSHYLLLTKQSYYCELIHLALEIITVFSIQLSSDLGDKILHVMETDIGLRKQYNRKYGLVWIICIPPVVKDTKKENGTLDFLLDTDENSILKMWNKH